jgi:hypothetical protein
MGEYHGSAEDRGRADSWYRRPKDPHYWPSGSYVGERVEAADMIGAELDAYNRGYGENEAENNHKED